MNGIEAIGEVINSAPSEAYVLGAILNDEILLTEFSQYLTLNMFQTREYRELWALMCDLTSKSEPIDLSSVVVSGGELIQRIGVKRLVSIQQSYMGPNEARRHAGKLTEIYARRMIAKGATELRDRVHDMSRTVDDLKNEYERIALGFSNIANGEGLVSGPLESTAWLREIDNRYADPKSAWGMVTGWEELDAITLGWQRSDLIVVGGRTSVGKTAFALENLIRLYHAGYKVAMFSLEMSRRQVQNRIAGNLSGVPLSSIRTGSFSLDERDRLRAQSPFIQSIAIDDSRGVSADYIVGEMKRAKRLNGLDFVIIDYIQEVFEPHQAQDNTGSAFGRIARKLRKAAKDCDCAVMALSQLSREAEGKKPKISDLSGSAGIESAADLIVLLHRDKQESPKMLEVQVAKQRNGSTDEVNMHYDTIRQRITGIRDNFRTT